MDREGFRFLEGEFRKQLAAKEAEIQGRYAGLRSTGQAKSAADAKKTNDNLGLAARTHGVSPQDRKNTKEAIAHNRNSMGWFLEREMAKEIETVRKSLEKAMFADYGGSRIKGREQVFGPEDPEVKRHKQAEQERLGQEAARKAQAMKKTNELAPASRDFNRANERPAPSQEPQKKGAGRGR